MVWQDGLNGCWLDLQELSKLSGVDATEKTIAQG
jgi:hypothetical protein